MVLVTVIGLTAAVVGFLVLRMRGHIDAWNEAFAAKHLPYRRDGVEGDAHHAERSRQWIALGLFFVAVGVFVALFGAITAIRRS